MKEGKKLNEEKKGARRSDGNASLPEVHQRSKGEKPEWRHKESPQPGDTLHDESKRFAS
jgi:hypothetical protein